MTIDYNEAGPQRTLIPDRTIVPVRLTIHPGGIGEGGWLTRSKDGCSEGLECEFVVTKGEYAKRKFRTRLTVGGTMPKHTEAAEITRRTLRAILESARNIRPDDTSEVAKKSRIAEYGDFEGLCFLVRVGVEPAKNEFPAKNNLREVITPDRHDWRAVDRVAPSTAMTTGVDAAITAVIAKPEWAK